MVNSSEILLRIYAPNRQTESRLDLRFGGRLPDFRCPRCVRDDGLIVDSSSPDIRWPFCKRTEWATLLARGRDPDYREAPNQCGGWQAELDVAVAPAKAPMADLPHASIHRD